MQSASAFLKKHESFALVAVALFLAGTLFTIERLDMLPLQGAAMPMYGSMPLPALHKAASSVSRKPSLTAQRKAIRMTQSSSSRMSRSSVSSRSR